MKRVLGVLLTLMLLLNCAAAEEELVTEPTPVTPILRVVNDGRLIDDASTFTNDRMEELVNGFNTAIDALGRKRPPVYMYLVEASCSHQIANTFEEDSPGYLYLKENLHADVFDHLKYTTYREFCDYFYTTDHHWNYKGSYQGYRDIVRMLLGEKEKLLEPAEEIVTDVCFNGSYAHKLYTPNSTEKFTFYRFDPMPQYKCFNSVPNFKRGRSVRYNHMTDYLVGKIKDSDYMNHYGLCYGGDYGILIFTGQGHKDRSLLIIGNSYSNPIKTMLTAHYGTIVYVDLRHYKDRTGEDFSLKNMIRQFNSTQVLLLGDVQLFMLGDAPQP